METANTEMLRGRVDIFVLNSLSDRDGYGYDILDYIHTKTVGHYEMKQSSIYSVLKRLEKQGYISSYQGNESNGGKRRYYSLTSKGKEYLESEKKEWAYTRTLLDNLVSDKNFDLDNDTPPFRPSDLRPLTRRTKGMEDEDLDGETVSDIAVAATEISESIATSESTDAVQTVENATPIDELAKFKPIVEAEELKELEEPIPSVRSASAYKEIPPIIATDLPHDAVKIESTAVVSRFSDDATPHREMFERIFKQEKVDNSAAKERLFSERDESIAASTFGGSSWEINSDTTTYKPVNYNKVSYKDILGDIFEEKDKTPKRKPAAATADEEARHIYDLKNMLGKEGHTLNSYTATSNRNYISSLCVGRLYRDISVLTYLFLVVMLLAVYLARNTFHVGGTTLFIVGAVGLLLPIAGMLYYFSDKDRRKKDNIKLNILLSLCGIFYLALLLLNVIIQLLIPNGFSLNSPEIYVPCIIALIIPFFGIAFALLYKSQVYHQKIK